MRFLLDANLPRTAAEMMRARGHEVVSIRDTDLASASDERVFAHAQSIAAVLVSRDLDFASLLRFPPAGTHGIVVLRLPENSRAAEIAAVLARFLDSGLSEHCRERIAIVEPDRVRFRPAIEHQR